jgi:uncharacterized protein involved in outer membrane biogenesis
MPETTVSPASARRRARTVRRLQWIGLAVALLVGLGVGLYLVLTSNAVLKALVLPRASAALNARVTAETIALRPLSEVRLTRLEITPAQGPRLLRAAEVTVRYRLWDLLRGRYVLPEIRLEQPELNLQVTRDGHSNLDALLARPAAPAPAQAAVPELDLGALSLRGGSLTYCVEDAAGGRQCSTVTNLELQLTGLKNGAPARLKLEALAAQINTHPDGATASLRARLQSEATVGLSRRLTLEQIEASLQARVTEATGGLAPADKLAATLALTLTPDELRQCRLRFEREGQSLGEARLSGPFLLARNEGRLSFQISSVGRAALALIGAPLGLDFGETALSGSGFVDLRQRGQRLITSLNLEARQFSVKQAGRTTPVLDLQFELRGNADLEEQTAYLERVSLSARTGGRDLLSVASQRAINLAWRREEPRAAAPATVNIALNDLRLADWQAWLPTNALGGVVNARASLTSAQDGRQLTLDLTNTVRGLGLAAGDLALRDLGADLTARLTLRDYRMLNLEQLEWTGSEGGTALVRGQATAAVDLRELSGSSQVSLEGELPILLARHPVPGLDFSKGRFRLNALLNWARARTAASLTALLGDLAGRAGSYRVDGYSAEFELSGDLAGDKLTLRRLGLSAREGTRSGGSGDLTGLVDAATQTAQFTLNLSGLNQLALRPFLAGLPGGVEVAALLVNANGQLRHDAQTRPTGQPGDFAVFQTVLTSLAAGRGETTFRLTGEVPSLVLTNRASARTAALNGLALQLDDSRRGSVLTLATNWIQLPSPRTVTNRLTLTGVFDLAPTNPAPSTCSLRAIVLDLTPLLDFAAVWESTETPPSSEPEVEPGPVELPLRQLTAELQVERLYLRDLVLRDWTARAEVRNGQISIQPCTLRVDDAPVSATVRLDLTRPGYAYEFGLEATGVHLGPLVDTFAPDYAGQIQGDLLARLQLSGAGITGPSLQRHLRGQATLDTTNLNFQVVTPRAMKLLTALATALRLEALANSPLNSLSARLDIADGQVNVRPFTAGSAAFWATAEGVIRLAPVLTNSPIDLPVQLALRADLARQIKLAQLTPSSRTNFLNLPPLVKVKGTLGSPETEIDKLQLTALLAGSVGGAIGGTAGDAVQGVSSLLQGNVGAAVDSLGQLIPGRKPVAPTNAPPATNAPAAKTNAPPAAPTNPPPRSGVLDLLEGLRKRN